MGLRGSHGFVAAPTASVYVRICSDILSGRSHTFNNNADKTLTRETRETRRHSQASSTTHARQRKVVQLSVSHSSVTPNLPNGCSDGDSAESSGTDKRSLSDLRSILCVGYVEIIK